jgi:amino acid adenylation domain-containing protein
LLFTVHHIVFDGWSLGVLAGELAALYPACRDGLPSPLPELAIQYLDYAAWQRAWLAGADGRRQIELWRQCLAGTPGVVHLPTDRPRPAVQTHRGAFVPVELPPRLARQLRALAAAEGATLFMTLLAGLYGVLQRHARQDDLSVGTFAANRRWPELAPLIGFFVNTLVLRTDLAGEPTFAALLARVRNTTVDAYDRQDVPFEMLLEQLDMPRDASRTALLQVLFSWQALAPPRLEIAGLEIAAASVYEAGHVNFDLALWLTESGETFAGKLQYNRDLFDRATILRLVGHLAGLLQAAAEEPARPVVELPSLAPAERHQIALEWGGRGGERRTAAPAPLLAHQLIGRQALRTPDAPAVVDHGEVLTYAELTRQASDLARRLRRLGAGPERVVGLYAPRCPRMIAGLLGILEAGAAWLPLDPALPAARLAWMLEDAAAVAVVAAQPLPADLAGCALPVVECAATAAWAPAGAADRPAAPLPQPAQPANLAYVLYTSGSTGRPKGVQVEHGALSRFVGAAVGAYELEPGERVLQFAAPSFDTSVEEIFPCLAAGATLVLRDDPMMASPARFLAACRDWQITVLDLPTAYWHVLAAEVAGAGSALAESLRLIILGGERALAEPVLGWLAACGPRPRLVNTYGPTEANVIAAACALGGPVGAAVGTAAVPFGRPWGGADVWLLDRGGNLAPVGVAGELLIGGERLARGYAGRPDLTAELFVPDPFGARGARLYRSGDLARWRADGCLEFAGRIDDQVKVRGIRVEPGEVAAALAGHPDVREAAVVARQAASGEWRLLAYVAPRQAPATPAGELRAYLQARLPAAMVPADYLILDALPRTVTGKLDRAALPAIGSRPDLHVPPRTATEALLAGIWEEVLERDRVGVNDNLFDLGGHSLLLPRLAARIETAVHLELPLHVLFDAPTVAQLAVAVEEAVLAQIEELSEEEAANVMHADSEVPVQSSPTRREVLNDRQENR